ncbi:MAG: formate dehydrogenase accessory sulfurtransferase FdhD [Chitinivibrionales bacterium]|nr:formate dehydrogenase accessory sulfurtransferase FdhD [Chitinivibrionales bacterium]
MTTPLDQSTELNVVRYECGQPSAASASVATEVPCTIVANEIEIATIMCSPAGLEQLAAGFLFTGGFVGSHDEILDIRVDKARWTVHCSIARAPDPALHARRVYTAGCGKGVVYGALEEMGDRTAVESDLVVTAARVRALAHWLQHCSTLYRTTHGVHTAGLSLRGDTPRIVADDIGRHSAVDKVIGAALQAATDFPATVLVSSGRVSSEILHKARRACIPLIVARGVPTHQAILRARQCGIGIVGRARGRAFTVYACPQRVAAGVSRPPEGRQ